MLLAKPVNILGRTSRRGLIIAKKESDVKSVKDLKNHRFAFGPAGDAASDVAAAYTLMQAGLKPTDIPRELIPIPLTRRHHLDSFEVAKAVAYEPLLDAGAVDVVAYSNWPDKVKSKIVSATPLPVVLQMVTKDRFRIIARTPVLPEGPIVASKKADPKLVATVKKFLLSGAIPAESLKPMEWQSFVAVDPDEYDGAFRMVEKLQEAGWLREGLRRAAATAPATCPAAKVVPAKAPASAPAPLASK